MTTTTISTTRILITGNTYPVKDQLRSLGGVWDKKAKGWRVPSEVADAARDLVASAKSSTRSSDRYQSNYAYFPSTGGEWYQNKNGRCEDAPCCGCCGGS